MKKATTLPFAAMVAILAFAAGGSTGQENSKIKVQDKIPSKAYPFDLGAVACSKGRFVRRCCETRNTCWSWTRTGCSTTSA